MEYNYESQKKALDYLIKNHPHDMDKFQQLYAAAAESKSKAEISMGDILFSSEWTADEKCQLMKLYGHDKDRHFTYKSYDRDIGLSVSMEGLPLLDQCIKQQSFSGVQALLALGNHISLATIKRIIEYIKEPKERYKYCELLVNHYKDQTNISAYRGCGNQCYLTKIPTLCDRYPIYGDLMSGDQRLYRTYSSMEDICKTNDLDLIKLFLPTIKNINPLLKYAIESKNIEMVKLFIEYGADVNFQDLEFDFDLGLRVFKTPLKIAIDNNDLEMVKFLHENGADLNFVDHSERMQGFIENLGKTEKEKQTHQYSNDTDTIAYFSWAKTPLEYAINISAASITDPKIYYDKISKDFCGFEEKYQNSAAIVKYLYDNGATFGNGKINYTDLICFVIKSDNLELTKYFFEEALKHQVKLDFTKIIDFIHIPGIIRKDLFGTIGYMSFEEGAKPWLRCCEEYSKKMDEENYYRNIKLMLEKIFDNLIFNPYTYDIYKDVIKDFNKLLPKEMLQEIPAVFKVESQKRKELLELGYDINCTNSNGNNIIMNDITKCYLTVDELEELISLGANINYKNPRGDSALSYAFAKLPIYDFGKFIEIFDRKTGRLRFPPEAYEIGKKTLIKRIIELSDEEIIMSDCVQEFVCNKIQPGYPQIIFNELLEALSKKGFKVSDDYFRKSLEFFNGMYVSEYVTDPWSYLINLYNNFNNTAIGTNLPFPNIKDVKRYEYGTQESNIIFNLINTHLERNFVTSEEQLPEPNNPEGTYFDYATSDRKELTSLQVAQNKLLEEISRYVGNLDYRQVIALLDSFPIIDNAAIARADILPIAIDADELDLCKELIKRGVSMVRYDADGHDITEKIYSEKQFSVYKKLNSEYNPNKECEDLLAQIGCGPKVYKKESPKQE